MDFLTCSIGSNVEQLVNQQDDPHCFRLHKDRVYYIRFPFSFLVRLIVRNCSEWL